MPKTDGLLMATKDSRTRVDEKILNEAPEHIPIDFNKY